MNSLTTLHQFVLNSITTAFSTRMVSALNNPGKLICHQKKNQTKHNLKLWNVKVMIDANCTFHEWMFPYPRKKSTFGRSVSSRLTTHRKVHMKRRVYSWLSMNCCWSYRKILSFMSDTFFFIKTYSLVIFLFVIGSYKRIKDGRKEMRITLNSTLFWGVTTILW